ncbi:hypothetical protein HDU76_003014, partial [Blyttiomyces sp. JEL0837]
MADWSDAMRSMFPTSFGTKRKVGNAPPSAAPAEELQTRKGLQAPLHPALMGSSSSSSIRSKGNDEDTLVEKDDRSVEQQHESKEVENESDEEEQEEEEDDEDDIDSNIIPVTKEIKLADHRRTISAVTLDPAGARLVTGGRDCMVKLWDFHGMTSTPRPFRSLDEPCGGNPIRDLRYSISGDQFLIASGSSQAKLYDREGSSITEYTRGDPYLRDQKNT